MMDGWTISLRLQLMSGEHLQQSQVDGSELYICGRSKDNATSLHKVPDTTRRISSEFPGASPTSA